MLREGTDTQIDPKIAEVIRVVNELRSERGLPAVADLPCGSICSPTKCPIKRALEVTAVIPYPNRNGCGSIRVGQRLDTLPPTLNAFVLDFDQRKYPQYEER